MSYTALKNKLIKLVQNSSDQMLTVTVRPYK